MYCSFCGKENDNKMNFCVYCGKKLLKENASNNNQWDIGKRESQQSNNSNYQYQSANKKNTNNINTEYSPHQSKKTPQKSYIPVVLGIGGVLVLFAVVYGILGRKDKNDIAGYESTYEYAEYDDNETKNGNDEQDYNESADESEQYEQDEDMDNYDSTDDTGEDIEDYEEDDSEIDEDNENEKDEYVLPNSDSEYISKSDLKGLTKEECRLALNELYARHGRKFDDKSYREYFSQFDWYEPSIDPEDFDESAIFNDIEIANRNLIVDYEKKKGWR